MRMYEWKRCLHVVLLACTAFPVLIEAATPTSHARPWSVREAIEMSTFAPLGNPRDGVRTYLEEPWLFSPDARQLLLLIERGDIERDVVSCELRLYSVEEIRAALATGRTRALDLGRTIARAASSTAADCMDTVRWSQDGKGVEFLAEAPDRTRQLLRYEAASGSVRQISFHSKGLLSYSSSPSGSYVYSAREPPVLDEEAVQEPFTIANEWIVTVVDPHRQDAGGLPYAATYATSLQGGEPLRIAEPTRRRYHGTWDYWISPKGRWAIGLRPPTRISDHWKRYRPAKDAWPLGENPETVHGGVLQFVKVDLVSGEISPLLDGLIGGSLERKGRADAIWSPTGSRVVLYNTFLPPARFGEREDRDPAIIEVDVETGVWSKVRTVEDVPALDREVASSSGIARSVAWQGNELEILVEKTDGSAARSTANSQAPGRIEVERYRKVGHHWIRKSVAEHERRAPSPAIELSIPQDCNEPPQLVARMPGRTDTVVLTDLNPQFASIDRPRFELVDWHDSAGRPWQGGLLLPREARAGQPLPLVVQYRFDPKYFRPDGETTSALAAASLANRGIAVLSLVDPPGALVQSYSVNGGTIAAELYRHGVESGIEHLVTRGIADRERLGLIGFSRSGYLAKYFLAQSSYPLRTLVVADSADFGYWQYLTLVGEQTGAFRYAFEQANGGKPFWLDRQSWLAHAPGFNLQKNETAALRLESYSRYGALQQWEYFAAYRILNRPVEMLVIPDGAHVLKKPSHRLLSQQGNVDWFAFWLKGEEDSVPEKREQYRRWRELRALRPSKPDA